MCWVGSGPDPRGSCIFVFCCSTSIARTRHLAAVAGNTWGFFFFRDDSRGWGRPSAPRTLGPTSCMGEICVCACLASGLGAIYFGFRFRFVIVLSVRDPFLPCHDRRPCWTTRIALNWSVHDSSGFCTIRVELLRCLGAARRPLQQRARRGKRIVP